MSSGAPIEKGQTIKYPSVALLAVDSSDGEKHNTEGYRVVGANPARIYINRQRPLVFGYTTRIALTEINVEWYIFNVNETNNTISFKYYDISGTPMGLVILKLSPGFYSAPRLAAAVEEALNTNSELTAAFGANTFTVRIGGLPAGSPSKPAGTEYQGYIVTTNRSQFEISTSSNTHRFQIVPYKAVGLGLVDDLTNMMGLTPSVISSSPTPYYKAISGGYASMMYTPYVDIVSNLLTKNQNVRDGLSSENDRGSGLLARIYLADETWTPRLIKVGYDETGVQDPRDSDDNAFGTSEGCFRREFKYPKQILWNATENIDFLDISLLDYRGNPLPFYQLGFQDEQDIRLIENTADIQFTLQVTEA